MVLAVLEELKFFTFESGHPSPPIIGKKCDTHPGLPTTPQSAIMSATPCIMLAASHIVSAPPCISTATQNYLKIILE